VNSCRPRAANSRVRWLQHCVVNFLELHSRPAHADERDKRCEHFVAAFTDLIDPRVAHHSFQLGAVTRERRFLSLAIQFRQYVIFAVRYPLYEMATDMLMQTLHV
jgi:hypothetical protein